MTSAFKGSDAAIVAFISAVVAAHNQERPALPSLGAHIIGQLTTRGLITLRSQPAADLGRHLMEPRSNRTTEPPKDATP